MRETAKILYVIVNSILIAMGLIIIIYGFKHRPDEPLGEHIPSASKLSHVYYPIVASPLIFLLYGIYINVLGTYGCYCIASAFSPPFIVYWHMVVIGIIVLSVVYMLIFTIYNKHGLLIRQSLNEIMNNYATDEREKRLMNAIQLLFNCCGKDDYQEWINVTGQIPSSCCRPIIIDKPCSGSEMSKKIGCADALYKYLEAELRGQMFVITFSSCLLIISFFMALAVYNYEIHPQN